MVIWFEGIILFMALLLLHSGDGVNPACECVVFQSYGLSQGRFHSPNFPRHYSSGIDCILYTFIGDVTEIVQLTFVEFDMAPARKYGSETQCDDFLRVFTNLDRPEVNEYSHWDYELCGNISELEDKIYYSSNRTIILEFHTSSHTGHRFKGFNGRFKFLDKSTFITDGALQFGTECSYYFQSTNNRTRGHVFSPRYPQKYPPLANCSYIFLGHPKERIRITFKNIQLSNSGRNCEDSSDKIVVYDGRDSGGTVLKQFCQTHNQEQLLSTGQYMYIQFGSDRHHQKQGFAAEFEFLDEHSTLPSHIPGDSTCNRDIFSNNSKNGTVTSPKYPQRYPSGIICKYMFFGVGQERVQLIFQRMNLHYTGRDPNDPYDCTDQDRIEVFVYGGEHGEEEERLGQYCGNKKPLQLMSSSTKMMVKFTSTRSYIDHVSGFQLQYRFRTDFGVQGTGQQDQRKVCTFTFNSSHSRKGTFTSPNFLGFYPRNTKCHYIFYGLQRQRVRILFLQFDVDGIVPRCDKGTKSDSVSFSNFNNAPDRGMPRYCGRKSPGEVNHVSDGAFFKVTFESNNVFESTGFKAQYTFIADEETTLKPVTPSRVTGSQQKLYDHVTSVTLVTLLFMCQTVILQLV